MMVTEVWNTKLNTQSLLHRNYNLKFVCGRVDFQFGEISKNQVHLFCTNSEQTVETYQLKNTLL